MLPNSGRSAASPSCGAVRAPVQDAVCVLCAIGVVFHVLHFVETPIFTRVVAGALGPEEYRALQAALVLRPEAGAVIAGTHGLRKLRWAPAGRGKRGGVRVIYYWAPAVQTVYLLYVYAKNEQGDLTPTQARALARLVQEEFG
jgi:mRNA-degrading endonuclease RelE of RelBE toxin-antitoxin system